MYVVFERDGWTIDDFDNFSTAKRIADNNGRGAYVVRCNRKDGPAKGIRVYTSEVKRPTDYLWRNMNDVVLVLEHFLADRGLDFGDLVNSEGSARAEMDREFRDHLFGFNMLDRSIRVIEK